MELLFTNQEKRLAKAIRRRLFEDYRFDLCNDQILVAFGDRKFLLPRNHVTEAPNLSQIADVVTQALTSTF
jgi:hypothetical protein